jgi:type I restriction enzyme M protein
MTEVAYRDPLCRFYTLPHIGDLLVSLMATRPTPRRLVDLGAGAGILSDAATRRWGQAEIVTVDMDSACAPDLRARFRRDRIQHVHHTHDALDPDLPQIVSASGTIDAAVCNPPYIRPEWRPGFERVLEEAGLADAFASTADVTAEALFLAQAVRLTNRGGSIGLIVPDGLITGLKTVDLRRLLLEKHRINAVVQLPRGSFKDTDAQAFILVFGNYVRRAPKVKLMRFDNLLGLSQPVVIDQQAAEHRLDYEFHAIAAGDTAYLSLSKIGAQITRGNINATWARSAGIGLFHTTDFNSSSSGRLSFPDAPLPTILSTRPAIVAEPSDILIARVDRRLHKKVSIVIAGRALISDCVHRVRVPENLVEPVYSALRSEEGARRLAAATRGVGARHLCKAELLDLAFLPEHEMSR